ncbi:hypothetical protein CF327_g7376 [Tilletia walkeri]|nr:hypothetical protein CF327_g7376 [Tilletia walkeri]
MEQIIVLTLDPVPATSHFRTRFTSVDYHLTGLPASFPITLDGQRMKKIQRYTMHLLRWIGRQPQWFCQDDNMPYLLVPTKMEARDAPSFDANDFEKNVDLDEVARLGEWTTKAVLESGMSVSLAQFWDRILLEKKHEIGAVAYAVTGVTRYKEDGRAQSERSRTARTFDMPNVSAEALGTDWFAVSSLDTMLNWAVRGNKPAGCETKNLSAQHVYVSVHAISASVYRSGLVMPTILDHIHQALSAQRCNEEIFGGNVAATHLIEALTAPSAS